MFPAPLELLDQLGQQPVLVVLLMAGGSLAESALGVGALVPGETLVAAGATVLAGHPVLWLACGLVAAAAFLGDHVGYAVGRRLGPAVADSGPVRKVGRDRWDRVAGLVERHAVPTLVVGRLVPGVRTLIALAAGVVGVRYGRFALGTALAALVWSAVWVYGGAAIGSVLLSLRPVHTLLVAGAALVVGLAVRYGRRLPVWQTRARGTWATWPNAITVVRLLLTVPLCLWLLGPGGVTAPAPAWVVAVAVAWAGSDWVDGALARRLDQRTRLGEVLDPVADRIGVLAVCLSLAVSGLLPWWPVLVIVVTDAVVALGAGPAAARGRVRVGLLGKARTGVLLVGLTLVLSGALASPALLPAGGWTVGTGALLHVFAGVGYLQQARAWWRAERRQKPSVRRDRSAPEGATEGSFRPPGPS